MKIKHISPIEQHFDKAIFGLAVVALLATAYLYWMRDPHQVTHDGKTYGVSTLDSAIASSAKQLSSRLNGNSIPEQLRNWKAPDYRSRIDEEMSLVLTPASQRPGVDRLSTPGISPGGGIVLGEQMTGVDGPEPVHVPVVPRIDEFAINDDIGTIMPDYIGEDAEWRERKIVDDEPFDVQWVSIAADFDMATLREELEAREGSERAVPVSWWGPSQFAILDVQIERESQQPDGSWGERTIIDALPGDPTVRPILEDIAADDTDTMLQFIIENQWDVIQPLFPDLVSRFWLPPGTEDEHPEADGQDRAEMLRAARAERLRTQRESRRPKRENRREPAPDRGGRRGGVGPPGAGPGGLDLNSLSPDHPLRTGRITGGAPGGAAVRPPRPQTRTPIRADVPVTPIPAPVQLPRRDGFNPRDRAQDAARNDKYRGIVALDTVTVWGSDLTVKPGATYRYRIRVLITNPLFGQPDLPRNQRDEVAGDIALAGAWSDWSQPIALDHRQYFFLVNAQQQPEPGATVEVYRYFNGGWRSYSFRVVPGDPIGTAREMPAIDGAETVDFSTGSVVVDLDLNYQAADPRGGIAKQTTTARLLFSDGEQLETRILLNDRENPKRRELVDLADKHELAQGM